MTPFKDRASLKAFLDEKASFYEQANFLEDDPIAIPHKFSKKQDIEIIGFWTAILAWGQRKTIINKANELIDLMGGEPYNFVLNHKEKDLIDFQTFKHRTFQPTDALYFLDFFKHYYQENESLETAFVNPKGLEAGIGKFKSIFFDRPAVPNRTKKHIASPLTGSTCKRLNMFLRWMVRPSTKGVDFGLWKQIKPSELFIPYDVHVERIAHQLGLIDHKKRTWKTVVSLTNQLKDFDAEDPVKYDFALFGIGVNEFKKP